MNVGRYLRGEDRHVGSARTTKKKDPLDTPLPCDVKVGHVTIRKGVALRTLVARMQVLYDMAQPKAEQEPKREWVGLTDDEINHAYADSYRGVPLHEGIEAKLKEKNT